MEATRLHAAEVRAVARTEQPRNGRDHKEKRIQRFVRKKTWTSTTLYRIAMKA